MSIIYLLSGPNKDIGFSKEIKEMLDKGLENGKTIDQIEGDLEEDARHFKTREL